MLSLVRRPKQQQALLHLGIDFFPLLQFFLSQDVLHLPHRRLNLDELLMFVLDLAFTLPHLGTQLLRLALESLDLLFEVAVVLSFLALLLGCVKGCLLAAVDFLQLHIVV